MAESSGMLQVNVTSSLGMLPVQNASIKIYFTGEPDREIAQAVTDESGQTGQIILSAPPLSYSMEPGEPQPYAEYSVDVSARGYKSASISGVEILPDVTAVLPVSLSPDEISDEQTDNIVIPPNTLFGDYPPKIDEAEIKPLNESGEIVLSRVVIPEYVIVHDGPPADRNARDYYVRYRDYIKNVASSEIYATWPDATLRANILAIMSFTLNRVYTEWYRVR